MEHILPHKIISKLDKNNILVNQQHGYRQRRSFTIQGFVASPDAGEQIAAILFDFSKSVDAHPHQLLIVKLRQNGTRVHVLTWIKSVQTVQSQQVIVKEHFLNLADVIPSIPPDSVL